MSVSLMTEAFKTDLPTVQKFVLVALCDNANDQGECYPSISRLMTKCSLSERSVRKALRDLEAARFISCRFNTGRSTDYRITDPGTWCPPARGAPRQEMPHPPAGDAPPPRHVVPHPPAPRAPITINEPSVEPSVNQEQGAQRSRGSRLPADWSLTDEYRVAAASTRPDWPAGHVDTVAASFRDYWISQPGAKGRKADWLATWRNWCRSDRTRTTGTQQPNRHDLSRMNYTQGVQADGGF